MESQTRYLLRECSLGCKMAINSLNQIRDYAADETLKNLLDTYDKKHKSYEEEIAKLLEEGGSEEKEPGVMASAFSRIGTEIKLMKNNDSSQIAKLMIDGCSMGIKSLGSSVNQYKNASSQSRNLAEKLIQTQEELIREMEKFL